MIEDKNPLIGKIISKVELAEDREAIKFTFDDGKKVVARADGECCSHTWIEDVFNHEALIGSKVVSVEDIELPKKWRKATKTSNSEEEMQYYGCAIVTSKGKCTIAYRNSSNGYYGGNLSWPSDDYFYGGVFGQNKSNEKWRLIE